MSDAPDTPRLGPQPDEIANLFTYHPPHGTQVPRFEGLRAAGRDLAEQIMADCPASPERSTAILKVREAIMWANAAIACREPGPEPTDA